MNLVAGSCRYIKTSIEVAGTPATALLLHMNLYLSSGLLLHMGLGIGLFLHMGQRFSFYGCTNALIQYILISCPVSSISHFRHYKSSAHGCTRISWFYTQSAPFPISGITSLQHLMRGIVSTYQGLCIRSLSIPFSHYTLVLPIKLSRPTALPRPDALFQLISTFSSLSISCGNSRFYGGKKEKALT